VTCLTCDDSLGDIDAEEFPLRKAWSGSNDFTLREWIIHTWRSKKAVPAAVKEDKEAVVVEIGRWKVGMLKGKHMHGHKNGLKTLLKLGPILWSGSDDASIRLWRCIDGECIEVVEDAHAGSVNKLAVVKCFVWSAGADGLIKEWSMTGDQRVCLRQVAPPGSEKGIYALLPLGHDVWVCGHHPSIQVYSQRDMAQTSTEDGHKPYVSNLIGVDRVESKIIWSTSFGDRKLKVWRHTVRGEEASVDELKAANILYQQEEETQAERIESYLKKMRALEESSSGQQGEIDLLQKQLEDQTAKREELEVELGTLQKIFEEAGLAELLKDPEALAAFLARAAALAVELRKLGIESLLEDPEEMARLLSLMNQLQEILERCGLSSLLEKPSELETMLLRYKAMQASFEKNGFSELFEDTDRLDKFLETHRQVRLSFQAAGFENLLDDAAAAEQFFQKRQADLESSAAASESVAALQAQLQQVTQDLEAMQGQRDALQRECDEIKDRLEVLRQIFADFGLEDLLSDPDSLRNFLRRHTALEDVLRKLDLGHLLDDPQELGRLLELMTRIKDVLQQSGLSSLFEDPKAFEDMLARYGAMKASFERHGFEELFSDVQKLDSFLERHRQVRDVFQDAGYENLLDDSHAAANFLRVYDQGEYDRVVMAKLRQVFGEAGQSNLLVEFEAASTTDGGECEDADFEDDDDEDEADEEPAEVDEDAEEAEEAEEEEPDEDEAEEDAGGKETKSITKEAKLQKPSAASSKAKQSPPRESFPALRAYLSRTTAFERVLRDEGMEHLLNDPPELGRLLRLIKSLMSTLETHGLKDAEKDPSLLAEILSAYRALQSAFREYDMEELFEDPEYALKAFLRNHHRIRAEFDKYGLGYLFDSVPSMRDFLAKYKDMEQELKAVKEARAGERLAQRDADMARLESRLLKKEEEIEDLKARLKEFEQLGDVSAVRKWKADSEELKRLQRIYNSTSSRLAELERALDLKEKEREAALEKERLMAVKYKELDIFKLDIIARELKALDNELGRVGSGVKSLSQDSSRLRNYDEQQMVSQHSNNLLDQCKLLRAHIRDVINKCLSETQKMHIGVGIDDYLAAGELKDGGTMIAAVYEEIERPDHGSSKAAKLRQQDERRG